MIDSKDNATLDLFEQPKGRTYKVYKNLHNGKLSILDKLSGLVVGHANAVMMERVKFQVSEKGRQRVINSGSKNVHAFVLGHLTGVEGFKGYKGRVIEIKAPKAYSGDMVAVTYNPFLYKSFVMRCNCRPIHCAKTVTVDSVKGIEAVA